MNKMTFWIFYKKKSLKVATNTVPLHQYHVADLVRDT